MGTFFSIKVDSSDDLEDIYTHCRSLSRRMPSGSTISLYGIVYGLGNFHPFDPFERTNGPCRPRKTYSPSSSTLKRLSPGSDNFI